MTNFKANSSFSIASSTSISIFPSRDINSQRFNSTEFSRFLFEGNDLKTSERAEDDIKTIREYEDIDENVATYRPEPSIFCTNCYENIEIDDIDEHSKVCVTPLESYKEVLSKLKNFLVYVRELKLGCRDNYLLPLILLEDIAKKILNNRSELFNTFERINSIIQDYSQYPTVLLVAQRLSRLTEALLSLNYNLVLQEPNEKLKINIIDSTIQKSKLPQDSFISGYSDISVEFTKGRSSPAESPEALEKYFYSKCLKKKIKSTNQDFSMFALYQECIQKKVPVEDWDKFILKSL